MSPDFNQIQISARSRGIADHFFCFTCDEYVWDCDHLIEERLSSARVPALDGSKLESFAYDGRSRLLEIEFGVMVPYTPGEIHIPPPPRVIQYLNVPRYVFTTLTRCRTARRQERYWENNIRTRFGCQTVRTVCRLPRIRRFSEARLNRYTFEEHLMRFSSDERQAFRLIIAGMKMVLLRTLAPRGVAGLGGLMECQCCGGVGALPKDIRHRNCLWFGLSLRH